MKDNTEEEKQTFINEMEDGGFTIVLPEGSNSKKFVSDGATTVKAASMGKTKRLQRRLEQAAEVDEEEVANKRKRQKKELYKNDFYKFQIKEVKKDRLEDLQKGFALDKIKLVNRKRRKIN